jgi:hypothetical protein
MHYTINETRSRLTIHADPDDRARLAEIKADDPDEWGTIKCEGEILEPLICNSELEWINPADTGDLTDAPMLGIIGGDEETTRERKGPCGAVQWGSDEEGALYAPILERWAFMSYEVRSFCDDLLTTGEAVFINGD